MSLVVNQCFVENSFRNWITSGYNEYTHHVAISQIWCDRAAAAAETERQS